VTLDDLGPLFETPITRVLAAAPPGIRAALARHVDGDLLGAAELGSRLRQHVQELRELAMAEEFLDLVTAERLSRQCDALLSGLPATASSDQRRLVQLAVLYFIDDDDAECDTTSPIGFDDDAEVIALVAKELGREDVLKMGAEG
jgi:hypothetical protein